MHCRLPLYVKLRRSYGKACVPEIEIDSPTACVKASGCKRGERDLRRALRSLKENTLFLRPSKQAKGRRCLWLYSHIWTGASLVC